MQSKPKLFCLTYAGGTAAFFDIIEKDLDGVEVVKLEYAGHGERHTEPFYKDFDQLADDIFERIRISLSGDYALFGYSMGSISAVEVLKRILSSDLPRPGHVFLAAHEPHTKSELLGFTTDELDEWVKQRTIRFGDVPEKLLNNRVFWRTYLPIYRADYSIIAGYQFEALHLKTDIPAAVFYSETDTSFSEMKQWERFFTGQISYHRFEGNHFFIRNHHKEMAKVITDELGVNE